MLHVLGDGELGQVVNTDKGKEPAGYVRLVRVEVWVVPEVVQCTAMNVTHA